MYFYPFFPPVQTVVERPWVSSSRWGILGGQRKALATLWGPRLHLVQTKPAWHPWFPSVWTTLSLSKGQTTIARVPRGSRSPSPAPNYIPRGSAWRTSFYYRQPRARGHTYSPSSRTQVAGGKANPPRDDSQRPIPPPPQPRGWGGLPERRLGHLRTQLPARSPFPFASSRGPAWLGADATRPKGQQARTGTRPVHEKHEKQGPRENGRSWLSVERRPLS